MAPADSKDWLFAAVALTSAMTTTPMAASASDQAGVVTGVLASTQANPADQTNQVSVVLGDVVRVGASFRTGPEGVIHILFLDQSSITIGPDSVLSVDQFTHDPQSRSGQIGLMLSAGSVRVVGGLNSKTNPTRIRTSDATVEILGGITMVQSTPTQTTATFLFGQQMSVSGSNGSTQSVVRPGFSVSTNNGGPTSPQRIPPQQLTQISSRFEANPGPGNTGSPVSTPGPTTPLIATSDRGSNQPASSPSAIANDRLSSSTSTLVGSTISSTRSDSIGTTERQTLATTVRTQTVQVSS
ncbi:MAG: hypothetical protein EAZ99_12970 [Alphaproteobacteria bacterium]|nr:MAG: hypothetical protein EAZ99_12970 [Alphaproteobacteria bacterium]